VAAWSAGRWIERPWGRLRVWETGKGPPLLAVHGLGGSGRYWRGLADALGDRYRVIAPDLGGFGASDKPRSGYDRSFHLANLDAVVYACAPGERVTVAGHSLGAMLALLWTARDPSRVRALALAATPYPVPHHEWDPARWSGTRAIVPRTVAGTFRLLWPLVSLPVIATGRYPGAVVRDYGRQTFRSRGWTMWSLWSDPALVDELPSIEAIPVTLPVLLAHATDDGRVPAANVERWGRHLPQAEPRVVPEGGHQFLLRHGFEPLAGWLRALPEAPSDDAPTLAR
jgi:pimeloyl-ACP methyl ester carboxylesterase